jgi:hypothetical protein
MKYWQAQEAEEIFESLKGKREELNIVRVYSPKIQFVFYDSKVKPRPVDNYKCTKVSGINHYLSGFDYVALINHRLWSNIVDDKVKEMIVYESMLHIDVERDKNDDVKFDENDSVKFSYRKCDIETFSNVLSQYNSQSKTFVDLIEQLVKQQEEEVQQMT